MAWTPTPFTQHLSISLPKPPEQSPAASEHPEVLDLHRQAHRCRAAWPLILQTGSAPLPAQSHRATGTTPTAGLPCPPLPPPWVLSEAEPRPPAPHGDKPAQTAGSLQLPSSTTSPHHCVPLIHAQEGTQTRPKCWACACNEHLGM